MYNYDLIVCRTPVKKEVPPEKDALVWRSLDKKTSSGAGLDESAKVATPLGDMKYYALPHNNADRGWVLENIKKKGIWYSMCHSRLVTGLLPDNKVKFIGLKFKAGDLITQADLAGLNLDYKLVMVDGCCSAMTERLDEFDARLNSIPGFVQSNPSEQTKASARNNNSIVDECVAFAAAFGEDSAYVGWAWIMNVTVAQNWTSDFLNNLKGGTTVQQAYNTFIENGIENNQPDVRLMKIYGSTDNVIDKTGENSQ